MDSLDEHHNITKTDAELVNQILNVLEQDRDYDSAVKSIQRKKIADGGLSVNYVKRVASMTIAEKNRQRKDKGRRSRKKDKREKKAARKKSGFSSEIEEEKGLMGRSMEKMQVPSWTEAEHPSLNQRAMMMLGMPNMYSPGLMGQQMPMQFGGAAQDNYRPFKGYCLHCGKQGHKRANCPELTEEQRKAFPPCHTVVFQDIDQNSVLSCSRMIIEDLLVG